MLTAAHYRLIQCVALHEQDIDLPNIGVSAQEIASDLGCSWQHADRIISLLVSPLFDGRRPWLARQLRGGVRLTEYGWLAVASIPAAPYAVPEATRAHEWINRKRWPWTEKDSRTFAVIPTGGTV
jgi:hypothetical protein